MTQNQALRHANVQVINNDFCIRIYGNQVVIHSTLCTAGGRTNVCGGDSGGPLVVGSGANRQQVSVSSGILIWLTGNKLAQNDILPRF